MAIQELFDLRGRVAIVTGGATHLGRAMATALGELGASVVIASRRQELCEQVAAEMRDAGIDCLGFRCDVTVEEEVDALVRTVVRRAGATPHHGVQRRRHDDANLYPQRVHPAVYGHDGVKRQEHLHLRSGRGQGDDTAAVGTHNHYRLHPRRLR